MGDKKVQGEGDYEGARRYRKAVKKTIEKREKEGKPLKGHADKATAKLTRAEREGRSHAKEPQQDKRDARYMDELENDKD